MNTHPAILQAARALRPWPDDDRLLHVDPARDYVRDARVRDLPSLLSPGDLLVVNDAATLPASLSTVDGRLELRLLEPPDAAARARVIAFGPGDFRTPTELRPLPRALQLGERLDFGDALHATVREVDQAEPRLLQLQFDRAGSALFEALYRYGRLIQYAYLPEPVALPLFQTRFAARPWAMEMPCAGRPLTFAGLQALRARGVALAAITHAAGISSTGSEQLDRRLPLPERYAIGEEAVAAIALTKARGGRVVAAGTTVVRALEASALAHAGQVVAEEGIAHLVLGPSFQPRVVAGLLTGMHPPGTSHFELMQAFAPRALLERALEQAARKGYLEHELGDSCLVYSGVRRAKGE